LAYTGTPFPLAFLLAMGATALVGAIVERMAYYPLRKSPLMSQIVAVLGISIIMDNLAMLIWGSEAQAFPSVMGSQVWTFAGVRISLLQFLIMGAGIVLMVALYFLVYQTKVGAAMRATSLDADAASLMGINVERLRLMTFTLSAALAAAAGTLIGAYYRTVIFNMGYGVVIKAFVVAILGGMGNVVGAMLGGLLMGLIECFGAAYIASGYKDAFVYIVLFLVLLLRPNGLLGTYEKEKV
jgi:branched-chain amino acid transport system permease protein